ncbi:MAG: ATP-binding protein [Kiritimatiellae bacterium]|nr:ATP-binding protein [Kiritimatiellia bacterium]
MDQTRLDRIHAISERRLAAVSLDFRRSPAARIDWETRLLGILGSRGVGKTTLLLQRMKETASSTSSLHLSLDNIWLSDREAYETAEHHVTHGGTHLFLDEVHFLDGWQTLLKNLHDDFPRLHIAYTGSSLLRIDKAAGDLSRRQVVCRLPPMSFREYLDFAGLARFEPVSLPRLLDGHTALSRAVLARLGVVLPHFEAYLRHGAYPFFREAGAAFRDMLLAAANQVLDSDWPKIDVVEPRTVRHARRMMAILAASVPQAPNVTALCRSLGVDRKQGIRILYALERAGLLALLAPGKAKLKTLATPEKIYCGDPNLMHALSSVPDPGTLRETFFFSQLSAAGHAVASPPRGDFLVDDRYLFEVGGPGKTFRQIAGVPDSFLAVDGLETGRSNRIPLWLFGFLY